MNKYIFFTDADAARRIADDISELESIAGTVSTRSAERAISSALEELHESLVNLISDEKIRDLGQSGEIDDFEEILINSAQLPRISNDLVGAYEGYYEDELPADATRPEIKEWCKSKILSHTPKERLEIYLEWNEILGYNNRIWDIAKGEL